MRKIEFECVDGMAAHGIKCLRKNTEVYNRILESFDYLGFFDKKVKAKMYGEDKKRGKVEVAVCDSAGSLFILTCKANNPDDLYVVRKINEDEDISYDLSLIKKTVPLSNDNIDICRVKDKLMSRHGRMFTDERTFLTLFLGHGYTYQMLSDFNNPINKNMFLNRVNSYENKPTYREFINIIKELTPPSEIDNILEVNAYKHGEKIYTVRHVLNEEVKIMSLKK